MNRSTKKKMTAVFAGLALLVGTTAGSCDSPSSEQNDPTANANFEAAKKAVPVPVLSDSLERRNISEHLKRNNAPERTRYIYLISQVGTVFAYYTIKGKVTSAGAQLTPTDDFARRCSTCDWSVVQGPTDDNSYGGDEGGVYFFTSDGQEVQWNGEWLLFDQPMKIDESKLALKR